MRKKPLYNHVRRYFLSFLTCEETLSQSVNNNASLKPKTVKSQGKKPEDNVKNYPSLLESNTSFQRDKDMKGVGAALKYRENCGTWFTSEIQQKGKFYPFPSCRVGGGYPLLPTPSLALQVACENLASVGTISSQKNWSVPLICQTHVTDNCLILTW